jgi:hypothetical protein
MPTYNMLETMHNIWLQNFGNCGAYLYATIHLMIMFKLSSNQHFTMNLIKVVIPNKDLTKMNLSHIQQGPNLVT